MKRALLIVATALLGFGSSAYAQDTYDKPCKADAEKLCPNAEPGAARLACLKEHKDELSAACKKKVMEAKGKMEEQRQQPPAPEKQRTPESPPPMQQ